ncbi:hypothetical protein BC629DRAFT_1438318 [Irpex lacteus]|nr:hypothetical protein BC629DRAFT_1438318 [Irpex lacteus]
MSLILDTLTLILAALLSLVFPQANHRTQGYPSLPFPSKSRPSWLIINAEDILYKSDSCDLLVGAWLITCWFFPRLLRQTAGPWFNAEVDDVRIRIMRSNNIPHYVQLLRANVVEAVLTGEILRVDDFATTVRVDGLSESAVEQSEDVKDTMPDGGPYNDHLNGKDGSVQGSLTDSDGDMKGISNRRNRECAEPFHSKEQDEMRISVHAETVHINNRTGRYYSFGSIDAQHRRNWTANRGTFVLIVEEARWIKTPMPYEMVARSSWPVQLFAAICHFPFDIWRLATHPTAMANIYVPRADITFDNFRMRDAEIVVQGISLVRENMAEGDKHWNDIFADGIANLALVYAT